MKVTKIEFRQRNFNDNEIVFIFETEDGHKHTHYNHCGITHLKNNYECELCLSHWLNTEYWKEVENLLDRKNFSNEKEYDKFGNYVDWETQYDEKTKEPLRDKNGKLIEKPIIKNVFQFLDKFIGWLIEEINDYYGGKNEYMYLDDYHYENLESLKLLRTINRPDNI